MLAFGRTLIYVVEIEIEIEKLQIVKPAYYVIIMNMRLISTKMHCYSELSMSYLLVKTHVTYMHIKISTC